ncbi:NDR1/HIN1-like protein 12 [Curcuma longa]|uniref:NDR1/HIN1-like protein 12 n=1 Tax=Curcuma longa TaxID=136217 RepID=UPI003D9EB1EE
MSAELHSSPPHHLFPNRFFYTQAAVRSSLTRRAIKLVCSVFLSLLLVAGVLVFVLWLALRPHRPRFHVLSFSAAGLSSPGDGGGLSFTFNVSVRNPNGRISISYDSVFGSVYYRNDRVGSGGPTPAAAPFYQPPKNTKAVIGEAAGVAPAPAAAMIAGEAAEGSVGFRLEMTSVIRFSVSTWGTRRHRLHVSCNVDVGGADGLITVGSKDKRCSIYFL